MSKEFIAPLSKASSSHDSWMCLWEAYGDPPVPPLPEDILPLVTPVVVPTTLVEIIPLDASTDPVPATDASDSVQQETPCLPISISWDDFLPDIAVLSVESYIEDVGDIIDDIHLLFVEENSSSLVAREQCDPQPLDLSFETDMIVDTSFQQMEDSFTSEETYQSLEIVFQFPQTSYLLWILPTNWGAFSTTPMAPFLPTRRNIIQLSWCSFFNHQGASFMGVHSSLRGATLLLFPYLPIRMIPCLWSLIHFHTRTCYLVCHLLLGIHQIVLWHLHSSRTCQHMSKLQR